MLWRSLKGAILGAAITISIGLIIITLFCWISPAIGPLRTVDGLLEVLLKTTILGVIIGVPAGIAAKLPHHGIRIIPSIGIVSVFTIFFGQSIFCLMFPYIILGKIPSPPLSPLLLCYLLTAFLGSLIVLVCGWKKTKHFKQQDANKDETLGTTPPE